MPNLGKTGLNQIFSVDPVVMHLLFDNIIKKIIRDSSDQEPITTKIFRQTNLKTLELLTLKPFQKLRGIISPYHIPSGHLLV